MKKIFCVVLSLIIVACSLSACSSSKNESEDNQQSLSVSIKLTRDSHYDSIDPSAIRAFEKVATAIINGDEFVQYNLDFSDDVNRLLYTGFPLISLVESINNSDDKTGVTIQYKNNKDAHLKAVADFDKKISEIMRACEYGKVGQNTYLVKLYNYVATNVQYDESSTDAYSAIMTGKGMSASISSMFEYLALQGGIKASHMVGKDAADIPWFFSRCMLGGQMYNFDIASECAVRHGEGLTGFAMTDKEIVNTGVQSDFTHSDLEFPEKIKIEKNKFSPLRSCAYFEIDGNNITAYLYSGKSTTITM